MDVVLEYADYYFFTPNVYPEWWAEDDIWRQFISLNIITNLGGLLLYLITATLSYLFVFDHELLKHPLILENQVRKEITFTIKSIPTMGLLTSICFLLEVRGYSRLYDNVDDHKFGWYMIIFTLFAFITFTDFLIYWIHRGLHHKLVYKHFHKDHHRWKVPTPFASHAFHPIDGFLQSTPYHIYAFCFPIHKFTYLLLYVAVNIWTVSIHDGDFRVPGLLKPIVNGSAHHTDHHVYYNYNYGQYFTLWDRLGGSFKYPTGYLGCGPKDDLKKKDLQKKSR